MNTALTKTHKVTDTLSTEACKVIGAALTEAFRQQMNNSLREKKKKRKERRNTMLKKKFAATEKPSKKIGKTTCNSQE